MAQPEGEDEYDSGDMPCLEGEGCPNEADGNCRCRLKKKAEESKEDERVVALTKECQLLRYNWSQCEDELARAQLIIASMHVDPIVDYGYPRAKDVARMSADCAVQTNIRLLEELNELREKNRQLENRLEYERTISAATINQHLGSITAYKQIMAMIFQPNTETKHERQ
jgi:hypothetical protein